jgi:hypothetical protein
MEPDHLYPSFVFFICPECHGSGKSRQDTFGEEPPCSNCEGKRRISVDDAIAKWQRSHGDAFDRAKILRQLDLIVPMKRAHMGVEVIISVFWHKRMEEFILEKR